MDAHSTDVETEFISKEAVIDMIEDVITHPVNNHPDNSQVIALYKKIRVMTGIRLIDFM